MSDVTSFALPPAGAAVRGTYLFVSPVDRTGAGAKTFDPARQGRFNVSVPPAGWYALGAVLDVARDDESEFAEVWSGAPAALSTRGRSRSAAGLRCTFAAWSKLAMALGSGSQSLNLLRVAATAGAADSGGTPDAAPALAESSATVLRVPASLALSVGDLVVVDRDYTGQTGFVGTPFAAAYVSDPARVNNDAHYLRRISFNLSRVAAVAAGASVNVITLDAPLPAGVPAGGMQVSVVQGFQDRTGGSFLSEWSALLVTDGVAGDRVLLHYPRLQVAPGATEAYSELATGLRRVRPAAALTALPVTDTNDGDRILCYRSYLPAPGRSL